MTCPDCGGPTVAFAVPERLREHAPGDGAAAALCARCFGVYPASDAPDEPTFSAVSEEFPEGDGGVAFALALGLLGSLALNRGAIVALAEEAEAAGVDVLLALDRLTDREGIEPYFDVDRRRVQLRQVL